MPRLRRLGSLLIGLGLILGGIVAWFWLDGAGRSSAWGATDFSAKPSRVSFKAPALALRDLAGTQHALSDYLGQVVLLNLWATWCPPCKAEMPGYQSFYEEHREQGFIVIGVNDGEARGDVQTFVDEHDLQFPVWLDPTYEATERAFKTRSLPTSYVIDRIGIVRLMWIGAISEKALEEFVTPLIVE